MTQTVIQQNLIPNDPELSDLLSLFRKDLLLGLNCHHVGTVKAFDAATQTAKVTINYKRTYFEPDALGVIQPVLKDYPILIDAPVIFLGGGNFQLTFPVASGDECLVIFNDRDIDNWFAGSTNAPVATPRLHAFSDAFVLVGLRSLRNSILTLSSEAVELRNKAGTIKVSVFDDKVKATAGTTSLEINTEGKLVITNITGEFVAALIQALSTATAGGFPLLVDLTTLTTFMAV